MTLNCKPGDLAYLSSDCVDEGVIVEVLHAGPMTDDGPSWNCKSRTPIACTMRISKRDVLVTDICVSDCYLRPISGVPLDDETPIETKLPDPLYLALGITSRSYAS